MSYARLSRVALALAPLAPFMLAGCASVPLADAAKPSETVAIAAAAAEAAAAQAAASAVHAGNGSHHGTPGRWPPCSVCFVAPHPAP